METLFHILSINFIYARSRCTICLRLAMNLGYEIIYFSKNIQSYFILNRMPLLTVFSFKSQEVGGVHMEMEKEPENFL